MAPCFPLFLNIPAVSSSVSLFGVRLTCSLLFFLLTA